MTKLLAAPPPAFESVTIGVSNVQLDRIVNRSREFLTVSGWFDTTCTFVAGGIEYTGTNMAAAEIEEWWALLSGEVAP